MIGSIPGAFRPPSFEGVKDQKTQTGVQLKAPGGLFSRVKALDGPISSRVSASSALDSRAPSRFNLLKNMNPSRFLGKSKVGDKQPPSLQEARSAISKKAKSKGLELPDFRGKPVDRGKTLTIVMHGTGQAQHKDQILSRVAEDAVRHGGDVLVLDGLGTSAKETQQKQEAFEERDNGGKATLMASHGNNNTHARGLRQNLQGSGVFKNAHSVVSFLSQLDSIPGHINLVGFSRGGVTATVTAALLDASLEHSGASDKHPQMKMVLFDPVAGAGKNKDLYSRDMLANNPQYHQENTLVFKSATDTRAHFAPQKGSVHGDAEKTQVFAGTHSGIEGKSQAKAKHQHHKDIAIIAERMTFDALGLGNEATESRLSDTKVLIASLSLAAVQEGVLDKTSASVKKSRSPAITMRAEGKALISEVKKDTLSSKLFVSPQVKNIFLEKFPQHAKVLKAMENAESRGGKQATVGLLSRFDQTTKSDANLSQEDSVFLNYMSFALKQWAGIPVGQQV